MYFVLSLRPSSPMSSLVLVRRISSSDYACWKSFRVSLSHFSLCFSLSVNQERVVEGCVLVWSVVGRCGHDFKLEARILAISRKSSAITQIIFFKTWSLYHLPLKRTFVLESLVLLYQLGVLFLFFIFLLPRNFLYFVAQPKYFDEANIPIA